MPRQDNIWQRVEDLIVKILSDTKQIIMCIVQIIL